MTDAEKRAWDKWAERVLTEALRSSVKVMNAGHTASAVAPRYVRKVVREADNG